MKAISTNKTRKFSMSLNRFLIISMLIVLLSAGGLTYIFRPMYINKYKAIEELECDSLRQAEFSIYDIAKILKKNKLSTELATTLTLEYIPKKGKSQKLSYQINNDLWQNNDYLELQPQDTIALKSLSVPQSNLYTRWQSLLEPQRLIFRAKRDSTLKDLRNQMKNHSIKVVSDIRLAENQAKLLETGKSTSALSLHQFGFASDIAISRGSKYLSDYDTYKTLGQQAEQQGLTWGGRFVGFVDPNHIQMFRNSSAMLANFPYLSFEYEPFISYYQERVTKYTQAGDEKTVEDSAELLQILNSINKGHLCPCKTWTQPQSTVADANANQNISIIYNQNKATLSVSMKQKSTFYKLGTWK
jgi:hypothetical protein